MKDLPLVQQCPHSRAAALPLNLCFGLTCDLLSLEHKFLAFDPACLAGRTALDALGGFSGLNASGNLSNAGIEGG